MPVDPIIERINELARKSRAEGLTDEERLEQQRLRRQYIEAFRRGLDATLDGVLCRGSERAGGAHQGVYEGAIWRQRERQPQSLSLSAGGWRRRCCGCPPAGW